MASTLRQQAKASTRAKVLAAAKATFETAGYERATIRDIARVVGMSTGAIFANFEDKAALYTAIYGHKPISPELGRALLLAARAPGGAPITDQLAAVVAMAEEA